MEEKVQLFVIIIYLNVNHYLTPSQRVTPPCVLEVFNTERTFHREFSLNSKASASELLEKYEDMFPTPYASKK